MDVYTGSAVAQANAGLGGFGPSVWATVFFAVMVFFVIYSAVLIFHWFSYSMHARTAVMATALYVGVSLVFVFSMLVSVVTLVTL